MFTESPVTLGFPGATLLSPREQDSLPHRSWMGDPLPSARKVRGT